MFFDKFIWCYITERAVRPLFVVFDQPSLYDRLGVFEIQEPMLIETFIPQVALFSCGAIFILEMCEEAGEGYLIPFPYLKHSCSCWKERSLFNEIA
jgi:hypothetical protein